MPPENNMCTQRDRRLPVWQKCMYLDHIMASGLSCRSPYRNYKKHVFIRSLLSVDKHIFVELFQASVLPDIRSSLQSLLDKTIFIFYACYHQRKRCLESTSLCTEAQPCLSVSQTFFFLKIYILIKTLNFPIVSYLPFLLLHCLSFY